MLTLVTSSPHPPHLLTDDQDDDDDDGDDASMKLVLCFSLDTSVPPPSSSRSSSSSPASWTHSWNQSRLPTFVRPLHYDLELHPDLDAFTNRGRVKILLQVSEPNHYGHVSPGQRTDFIVLHALKMNITRIGLMMEDKRGMVGKEAEVNGTSMAVQVLHWELCGDREQLIIHLATNLTTKIDYRLTVDFEKQLDDQLEGFYVSSYWNASLKRKRYLLTTHFEPTLARTAFPCFDEPASKGEYWLEKTLDKRTI